MLKALVIVALLAAAGHYLWTSGRLDQVAAVGRPPTPSADEAAEVEEDEAPTPPPTTAAERKAGGFIGHVPE